MDRILEIKAGSHLYGLNTPKSDVDYFGIYIEDTEDILRDFFNGKVKGREIDLSVKSKDDNGKNNKDAIDRKFFSLKKYANMAMSCNPTILECLYASDEAIVYIDHIGKKLMANRHLFLSKNAVYYSFKHYAESQMQKAETKTPKHTRLKKCLDALEENMTKDKPDLILYEREEWFKKVFDIEKQCYNLIGTSHQFPRGLTIKRAIKEVRRSYDAMTNRRLLVELHGYDSKFYSHNFRLLVEARDFLLYGEIKFPIQGEERQIIMDMKEGKYTKEEAEALIKKYGVQLEEAYKNSTLPNKPDYEAIEELIMEIYEDAVIGRCQPYAG